jgi:DmX-like protein
VCLWDVVVGGSPVVSWDTHAGGAHSIVYSPRHQLLVSGGKRGDIVAYDIRQRQIVGQIPLAHTLNVKALAIHPAESLLASASTDGSVKVGYFRIL